jgi:SAM-dependent methyltransferase
MLSLLKSMPRPSGFRRIAFWVSTGLLTFVFLMAVLHFPRDVDAPSSEQELEKARLYYAKAYTPTSAEAEQGNSAFESRYFQMAADAAKDNRIPERVQEFVDGYGLKKRPVIEIGSGRGYLQDVAEDYTGLDISATVARFYHKKFVRGSATALPFEDNSFDGAWSIWVLEHVPNPEQALRELRRVMRHDGKIMMYPAWNCQPWLAEGYQARPYSDFNFGGKLVKASIPVRTSLPYRAASYAPVRAVRGVTAQFGGPTQLRYKRLIPNYKEYWQTDSDALNGIDRYEMMLWFLSRGDECLNCSGLEGSIFMKSTPLIIRINKHS